ncbi:hypothetical protein BJX66DRAFT_312820 [Aspergillus keveii]|uniref:Uncharacterized protein n=1 Tax=Aspergillus keveii TaxID=714993 RepID=A0ABR4FT29_9EURO
MKLITSLLTFTLLALTATATQDPEPIRCETEADCPKDLPVCCGFSPAIQYCLPEGTVC